MARLNSARISTGVLPARAGQLAGLPQPVPALGGAAAVAFQVGQRDQQVGLRVRSCPAARRRAERLPGDPQRGDLVRPT